MTWLTDYERQQCEAFGRLGCVNPFLPIRKEVEHLLLGPDFIKTEPVWSQGEGNENPNLPFIYEKATSLATTLRDRARTIAPTGDDLDRYSDVVFMALYAQVTDPLGEVVGTEPVDSYAPFEHLFRRYFQKVSPPDGTTAPHLFACFYQIRRAFQVIFDSLIGGSPLAAGLRAQIWRSIFSADAGRYRRYLYLSMGQVPTLITGPTGTGKELVAKSIALSGYIPFNTKSRCFDHAPAYFPVNLSALSESLVASELFGHRKGSFTGATADRRGFLGECPAGGAVFLDEIGEITKDLQVKLLRVLEERAFVPVGDVHPMPVRGRILAATHVNLAQAINNGLFREDLYYRLQADHIHTPSLAARIQQDPTERRRLVRTLLSRWVPERELVVVTNEVEQTISEQRQGWSWPGNVRELAQCVRGVLLHGECPPKTSINLTSDVRIPQDWTLQQATIWMAERAYSTTGSYRAAGDLLGVNWRTLKSHLDG